MPLPPPTIDSYEDDDDGWSWSQWMTYVTALFVAGFVAAGIVYAVVQL